MRVRLIGNFEYTIDIEEADSLHDAMLEAELRLEEMSPVTPDERLRLDVEEADVPDEDDD